MQTRRLVLMRHAEAAAFAESDAERRLTERGRRCAAAAGDWLAGTGLVPDVALVSGALRTRETWVELCTAAGWRTAPTIEDGVYAGSAETVLDLLRLLADDAVTVLVVGHNPTMATLAQMLDDGSGDPAATDALIHGFPPAAVAVHEVTTGWGDLGWGSAGVVGFHAPVED